MYKPRRSTCLCSDLQEKRSGRFRWNCQTAVSSTLVVPLRKFSHRTLRCLATLHCLVTAKKLENGYYTPSAKARTVFIGKGWIFVRNIFNSMRKNKPFKRFYASHRQMPNALSNRVVWPSVHGCVWHMCACVSPLDCLYLLNETETGHK